jgi:hypothetical protein
MTYRFALDETVVFFLQAGSARDRRLLLDEFVRLAANPFAQPDHILRSAAERDLHVRRFRFWHIIYWVDHLEREVRITAVRLIPRA